LISRHSPIDYSRRVPQPSTLEPSAWAPTLRRSVRLFRAFRVEQTQPDVFYGELADDAVGHVSQYADLAGARMLDVGGGPGYFRTAFEGAGATYFALDADVGELSGLGGIAPRTVLGSGMELPFADGTFDVCYSSNVLEHVSDPWRMADEMVRVTRPGGLTFISYTVWFGPWGGHETSPWHYLGGRRARRRYRRRHGHEPKNKFGESLYAVTVGAGREWARTRTGAEVLDVIPRYNPAATRWLSSVPVLREIVTWNLVIVLRRR
jgi:SAM-dependent methyltransferase